MPCGTGVVKCHSRDQFSSYLMRASLGLFDRRPTPRYPRRAFLELLGHPGSPVGRYPGKVVVTLGVDPEGVVGDPVPLVTALVEGLRVAQDLSVRWPGCCLAAGQNERDTAPSSSSLTRLSGHSALTDGSDRVGPSWMATLHGVRHPRCHAAHQTLVADRRLRAKCSAHARMVSQQSAMIVQSLGVIRSHSTYKIMLSTDEATPQIPCGTGVVEMGPSIDSTLRSKKTGEFSPDNLPHGRVSDLHLRR